MVTLSIAMIRSPGPNAGNRGRRSRQYLADHRLRLVAGYPKRQRSRPRGSSNRAESLRTARPTTIASRRHGDLAWKLLSPPCSSGKELALLLRLGDLVVLALHRAEPADRQGSQRILRTAARARPRKDLWAEPDRKLVDSNAVAPRQNEVTELVKNDQDRKHHEKSEDLLESDEGDDG